jgi:hypothetical protein
MKPLEKASTVFGRWLDRVAEAQVSKSVAPYELLRSRGRCVRAVVILAAVLASSRVPATAGAKVVVSPQAVTVEAQNSTIEEILAALGQDFNLRYRSSVELNNRISGTYEGSPRQVVMRILAGYDFIVKSSPGQIEVTVLGGKNAPLKSQGTTVAVRSAAPPQTASNTPRPPPTAAAPRQQPAPASPEPGVKIAEGPTPVPMPTPMPRPSSGAMPMPTPMPSPASGAMPTPAPPLPGSKPGPMPMPEPLKPGAVPPMPPLPGPGTGSLSPTPGAPAPAQPSGSGAQNGPVPLAPPAHATGPN